MSASPNVVPLKVPRLVALSLAWAWGIVAGGTGLNALVKSNQEQTSLKHHVTPPTVLTISVSDIFHPGVVATAMSTFISALCSTYILLLLLPKSSSFNTPTPLSTRTLRLQAYSLTFCALWLFSVQIAFTHIFRTHSAQVHAYLGGVELPAQLVQTVEKSLGATSRYKEIGYLRLTAILPWFTILFTVGAAVVSFMAISRVHDTTATPVATPASVISEKEEPPTHQESA